MITRKVIYMNDCYNWEMEEALIDMESNTDFIEKYMSDDIESFGHVLHEEDCLIRKSRENAWVRKRLHKKKMYRQFLSWNPRLDLSKVYVARVMNGPYIDYHGFDFDYFGTFVSYIDRYWFNPYTHTYRSACGDLRVYHGSIEYCKCGCAFSTSKTMYKDTGRITNRRIRKMRVLDEDKEPGSRSYYKKMCGPLIDLW